MKKYLFLVVAVTFLLLSPRALAQSGCCSHHRGISHCDTSIGKQVCMDGTYSPSCTCVGNGIIDPLPPPTSEDKSKIISKINDVQNGYPAHHQGFRESLIQDILSLTNGKYQDTIGYYVYTMLPDITSSDCHVINGLPDLSCTPGATDPQVTQDNIHQTICVPGYTKKVRPPTSVTNKIKVERMQVYGFTDSMSNYELDHLISLEIGGSPDSVDNLWPESYNIPCGARTKDKVENLLHSEICNGQISLEDAQHEIVNNWEDVYQAHYGNCN